MLKIIGKFLFCAGAFSKHKSYKVASFFVLRFWILTLYFFFANITIKIFMFILHRYLVISTCTFCLCSVFVVCIFLKRPVDHLYSLKMSSSIKICNHMEYFFMGIYCYLTKLKMFSWFCLKRFNKKDYIWCRKETSYFV